MKADTVESTKLLAEVQSQILRRDEGCVKLQYTLYGKCMSCKNTELCQKLSWITEG